MRDMREVVRWWWSRNKRCLEGSGQCRGRRRGGEARFFEVSIARSESEALAYQKCHKFAQPLAALTFLLSAADGWYEPRVEGSSRHRKRLVSVLRV